MPQRLFSAVVFGLVFLLAVSHVGAALLALGAYHPGLALSGGVLLTVAVGILWRRRPSAAALTPALGWHAAVGRDLLLLLAVALLFRFAPLPEFSGGRDDGVYTNLAAHLTRAESPIHRDPTLATPPADGRDFLQSTRPQHVLRVADAVPERLEGRFEGLYLPGVYIADADSLTYVFQFLHVLPVWMSIVGVVAGTARMGYAVAGFSLLSVVLFHLLLLALGTRRRWALAGALLLAANPLHAYFAKNSVTESVALFFTLACLLALAWTWRLRDDPAWRWRLVGLAVAAYSAFCLTRISGFFFLPFLVVATILVTGLARDRGERRLAIAALVGCLVVFGLGVLYLRHTSLPYAVEQYRKVFAPLLGEAWPQRLPWILAALGAATAAVLAAVVRGGGTARVVARACGWLGPAAMLAMLAAVVVHVVKVHALATGAVADHVGYVARYDLAGHGWTSVRHASLVNAAVYLSPPVMALLGWELLRWRARSPLRTLLLLLLLGYFVYAAVLQWVLPYQFYYGRYLLPAVVPFTLLLVTWSADGARGAPLRWLAVTLGLGWCVWLSATQWQHQRGADLLAGLAEATDDVRRGDLLLLDRRGLDHTRLTLPLIYTLERNVWTFADDDHLLDLLGREDLLHDYDVVWVGSRLVAGPWLADGREVSFAWVRPERSPLAPLRASPARCSFTLSRVDRTRVPRPLVLFANRRPGDGVTVQGLHGDGVWTRERVVLEFDGPGRQVTELRITLHGWRPPEARVAADEVVATLNGEPLVVARRGPTRLVAALPEDALAARDNLLVLSVPTFVPAEVRDDSSDRRRLGLDLRTLELR